MVELFIKLYGLVMMLALGGLAVHVFCTCLITSLIIILFIITKKIKRIVTDGEKIQFKHHN